MPPSGLTGLPATVFVVIGGALIVAGGVMAFLGVQALGESFTPNPRPLEAGELVETGIYRSVRHPIYGGFVLGALGWGVLNASIASVVLTGLLLLVLYLKSIREEAHGVLQLSGVPRPHPAVLPDSSDGGHDARPDPCRLRSECSAAWGPEPWDESDAADA